MYIYVCVFVYIHRKLNRLNVAMGLYVCVCMHISCSKEWLVMVEYVGLVVGYIYDQMK